ncbi:MAG: glycosyltransferase family 4 protein [Bacteroidota bacterium]
MSKILHFSHKPAFPLRDGGCVAISSVLKSLISHPENDVYHFTLSTTKHPFDRDDYPQSWLNKMELEHFQINTRTDLIGALYYLLRNKSYNIVRFKDKQLYKRLRELLEAEKFDMIILESLYTTLYLSLFQEYGGPIIMRAHNVEHLIWKQLTQGQISPLKKWYFNRLSQQLKGYEDAVAASLNGIMAITEEDARYFHRFTPAVTVTAIPTAVKTNFDKPDYSREDFYFLGAMDWLPNKEGIHWLLKRVIPDGIKGSTLHIAGKSLERNEIKHENVKCHGEVDDAKEFINRHGICLIPMQSGSGIKIKLLENMAMAKPIITTSEGVRGVEVQHGREVLIADTPEDFREQMYALLIDRKKREKLGQAAKAFVIHNFGEEKITRRINSFIHDV